jgi:acetyl esterase
VTASDRAAPLTPAMRGVLERMARAGYPPLYTLTPDQARAGYAAGAQVLQVPPAAVPRVHDLTVPARDGHAIVVRLYAPQADPAPPLPALVFFHGGGFVVGSVDTHDRLCRELCRLSGCAVVSVDYRLAPEHPFPGPVHDAWDALQAVVARGTALGIDTTRLAVGGDSAGGNLAAVCALLARDAGLPLALQLLIYPSCAAQPDLPSHQTYASGYVLEAGHAAWFFNHYIGPAQRFDWRFAPLEAPDVDGVAPAWFALAECDMLVDDGIAYADRLRAAGINVALDIYRGVTHDFIQMGRAIPEARQFHTDAAAMLQHHLRPHLRSDLHQPPAPDHDHPL